MQGVSESLAGRVDVLELEPLSLFEIRGSYPELPLAEAVSRGGYPELYEDLSLDPFRFYRSYVATYLERDLRSALEVRSLRDFERFLRACAVRSGHLLNKAELARDVGISASTANEWLSVLVASNVVVLLEPWFVNRSKSITKSPKLYLADSGLLLYLLNVRSVAELLRSPLLGSIWETYVFSEMRKMQERDTGSWSIHFWRDRGKEVDFLVHRGGLYEIFEVKWSEHPEARDLAGFQAVEDSVGPGRVERKTVICRAPNVYPLAGGVRAVPLEELVGAGGATASNRG
jgi:hypothetical protein